MILSKCKLDEAQELEFTLQTFGTPQQAEDVRFVIEQDGFDISIPCIREGETLKVNIPKLKGIIESGHYDVKMEVIIDGKIFTPLKESIEFEPLIEFGVKKTKAESVKEGVRVTMKSATASEDTKPKSVNKLEESLRKVMEEGKDVTKINGKFVIKENESYIGLVTPEGDIKLSDKPYVSFTDFMKGM